jgi:D-alanyl-D-alanine carboxypeptidase
VFKPNLRLLWALPVLSIFFGAYLFPLMASHADETSGSTAAPLATPTRLPQVFDFDRNLYSLVDATSPWVVVNKRTPLYPLKYKPKGLTKVALPGGNPYSQSLAKPAADALVAMAKAMKAAGAGTLVLQSGYRSYASQVSVHSRQVARFGLAKGEALAARPGYSEHQTGLASDLGAVGQGCVIRICFAKTKAGTWLAKNAYKYGFILRYPDGKTPITGYQYEPWHFRYVGKELSKEMKLETYSVLELFWHLPYAPAYEN